MRALSPVERYVQDVVTRYDAFLREVGGEYRVWQERSRGDYGAVVETGGFAFIHVSDGIVSLERPERFSTRRGTQPVLAGRERDLREDLERIAALRGFEATPHFWYLNYCASGHGSRPGPLHYDFFLNGIEFGKPGVRTGVLRKYFLHLLPVFDTDAMPSGTVDPVRLLVRDAFPFFPEGWRQSRGGTLRVDLDGLELQGPEIVPSGRVGLLPRRVNTPKRLLGEGNLTRFLTGVPD